MLAFEKTSDLFRRKLETRTNRLNNLVEMGAPPLLICSELSLVLQAAIGCFPDEMAQVGMNWFIAGVRRDAGLCATCDNSIGPCDYKCEICKKDALHEEETTP